MGSKEGIAVLDEKRLAKVAAPTVVESISADDFVRQFKAYEWVIEDLIQPGYVYALTGNTGGGKTSVCTTAEMSLSVQAHFGRLPTKNNGAKVAALVGENPTDKQAHILATSQELGIAPTNIRVIDSAFSIPMKLDELKRDAEKNGPYCLVTVDTSFSYFQGDEENDNVQARHHAASLRELTKLPGNPAVLALCHPVKKATKENLLPRGGGAFLNEIDGNLTCWRDGDRVTVHWAGKLRGPGFDPLVFTLKPCQLTGFVAANGKPIVSVVAVPISDEEADKIARADWNEENRLLNAMLNFRAGSIAAWAKDCGWMTSTGEPHKSKVHRLLELLEQSKVVRRHRGRWQITAAGEQEIKVER